MIAGTAESENEVGDYVIRVVRDSAEGDRIVDITLRGRRVFAVRAADARIDRIGEDLTGDRIRDAVVLLHTGGVHCCTNAVVLSFGDSLGHEGIVAGGDGEIEFDDVDGDGVPEVKVQDWRFRYWRDYAFVETAAPEVIYRFQRGGGYRPACDLMQEDPPSHALLERHARELATGWTSGDPPSEVYSYVLDLVYAGNAGEAWQFFDLAWPSTIPGKTEYTRDLRNQLRGSPCWSPPPEDRPGT